MRRWVALAAIAWSLNQLRWARATRPEPLPLPPSGSTTVLAEDGTRLHAEVTGRPDAETTVVLVHGFLARSIEFDHQVPALVDRARVVRYDHREHGRSERTGRSTDVRALARDLARVVEELVPSGPVVLVGHSMGGMTVLALALERPDLFRERVRGVGLIATGAGHDAEGHPAENALRWAGRRRLLAPYLLALRLAAPLAEQLRPRRTRTVRALTRGVVFGRQDVDPALLSMTQSLLEEPPLSTFGALHGALVRHDALAALPALAAVPVVVVTGSDDRLTRPEHSALMTRDIGPSAELVVVEGAGHVVNQTRPRETNAALVRLLDRASTSRA